MLYFSAVNRFTTRVNKLNQLLIQNSIIMKKKVFITIVLALIFGASTNLKGQTTFERMIPIEGEAVIRPEPECLSVSDDGYVVNVPLGEWQGALFNSKILKFSSDGGIIGELDYNMTGGRVLYYWQIVRLPIENGGGNCSYYLAVAGLYDSCNDVNNNTLTELVFLVLDEELEVKYERIEDVSEIVEHYATWGRPRVVFDNTGNLVIATFARVNGGEFKRVYTHVELDKENWIGEITHFVRESPEDVGWIWDFFPLSDGTYREVEVINGPGGVAYHINAVFEAEKILEFRDMRFQRVNNFFTPFFLDSGGHAMLDDSTLFMPTMMTSTTDGIGTMKLSANFDTIKADIQDFSDYDTTERILSRHPVILRGDDLYMCYTRDLRTWHPSQAPYTILCKYNTNLNLIWKRWYRDSERQFCYYATDMVASNDGGILITGYCCKRDDYGNMMLYLLKVDADGLLSLPEAEVQVRPYCYYPNPVKSQMQMQFSPDVQPKQVELYDLQGRLVRVQSSGFESVDMSRLPAGAYMLRVTLEDGKVFSDKVVKE